MVTESLNGLLNVFENVCTLLLYSFNAGSLRDNDAQCLLMEEGIRLLKEFPKHPQCSLNMKRFVIYRFARLLRFLT